jgi:diguanylate cyclase (GGDEF)-like protein/PAS domain S-box-containing protein
MDKLKNKQYFEELFSNVPEGIVFCDREQKIIRANKTFCDMFGYCEDEVYGHDIDDLISPGENKIELKSLTGRAMSGEKVKAEGVRLKNDGTAFPVSVISSPVYDKNEIVGIFAIYRDISEQKAAEEALRKSEEKFRTFAESTPVVIMIYQEDKWIFANSMAEELTGYSKQELINMKLWDFVHPEYVDLVKERAKLRQQGEWPTDRYEIKIITKSGDTKWIDLKVQKIDFHGKPTIIMAAIDITEKKSIETALKKSEEEHRLLFENVYDMILLMDVNGNVVYTNHATQRILGYSPDKAKEINPLSLMHPDDKVNVTNLFRNVISNGEGKIETRIKNSRGEYVWIEANGRFLDDDKNVLIIAREITDRKLAEMRQERFIKLQKVIIDITSEVLQQDSTESSYQRLLERAVEIIPGAEKGSILIKENGDGFAFAAAVKYNLNELKKVTFNKNELVQGMKKEIRIIKDFGINDRLDEERRNILYKAGQVKKIEAMLSVPIVVNNKTVAFINLDNYRMENAYNDESIQIAKIFGNAVAAIFQKLSLEKELKEQRDRLKVLSTHDTLTGLPNRRYIEKEALQIMQLAKRYNRKTSVVYLDLNNFKEINDNFGHETGDYFLVEIASRIKSSLRKSDLVARMGGDEFVFILPETDTDGAITLVKRIHSTLKKPLKIEEKEMSVSGSMGISTFPYNGEDFNTLLRKADEAMYRAKKAGKLYGIYSK